MMEEANKNTQPEEQEIDLVELARKLWDNRRMIIKWCAVAVVVGLVVGFSIPKEYTVSVTLAPEATDAKSTGNLGALASMAGINLGSSAGADALYPELYPDVVSSVPFLVDLFPLEVVDSKGELRTTLYDYVEEHTRAPWWSAVVGFPFKALGWFMSLFRDDEPAVEGIDPFRLSKDQMQVVETLRERVSASVDKKTSVISLSVTMQDPLIAATMTDSVMTHLQRYITDYRTNKARHDLQFTQQLFDEAQRNYYEAQQRYASYMDANQNIVRRSVRTEQERLQNEMNLTYNLYNQMAQQLQVAKAKVQESTPVYAIVQPATVPIKASKPSKAMILIGFVFLAGCAAAGWILFGRDLMGQFATK